MELRKFGLNYSKRILNKNIPMTKYLQIAEEQGIDAALEELERDWKYRVISRTTYYRNRKLLLSLKEQVDYEKLFLIDYEKLFLKFLRFLAESDKEKVPKEELATRLGVSIEAIDGLKKWMEENGFVKIARLVAIGKKAIRESGKRTG